MIRIASHLILVYPIIAYIKSFAKHFFRKAEKFFGFFNFAFTNHE